MRGWRIAKEKASHKIDVVVALAMSAHGAVHEGEANVPLNITDEFIREFMAKTRDGVPMWSRSWN